MRAVGVSSVIGLVGEFAGGWVRHIRVTVGIVVGEGDLRTHPAAAPPVTERGRQRGHVRLRQARALHGTRECAVTRVETGVDDLDDLPRASVGGLGGRRHIHRGRVRGIVVLTLILIIGTVGLVHVIDRGAVAIHEGGLHARRRPNRCEGRGWRFDGKAVQGVRVLAQARGARPGNDLRDGSVHALLHLLECGSVVRQLDGDRHDGVFVLVGGRGLGGLRGPGVLRDGGRCVDCRHGEHTGDCQCQCQEFSMGHVRLTSLRV